MHKVAKLGEKDEEEVLKHQMMFFLSFVCLRLPGIGELGKAAELANVARLPSMIGDAGFLATEYIQCRREPKWWAHGHLQLASRWISVYQSCRAFQTCRNGAQGYGGCQCGQVGPGDPGWDSQASQRD